MTDKNIFFPVSSRQDRERVYARIVDEKVVFTIQSANNSFEARAFDRHGKILAFDLLGEGVIKDATDVIVSFALLPELYFMKARVLPRVNRPVIDLDADLFKLQRRDNFRLKFPVSYNARLIIDEVNSTPFGKTFPVYDLSGGGLCFEMDSESDKVRAGSKVTGTLKVGEEFEQAFVGTLKYARAYGSMGSGLYRCGVQFENMAPFESEEIIQLVLKIHRQTFARFTTL